MYQDIDEQIEQVVETLLRVGDRVVEVSKEQVMTRIWDRKGSELSAYRSHYEGKKISEIRNDSTIRQCQEGIVEAFKSGRDSYTEYISYNNDKKPVRTYSLRILTCHPDKNFVFLVIEDITRGNEHLLVEDKWKLALDASGHGVWDVNLEANTIFFSDKWEELVGYSSKEIISLADWSSKIHPDDFGAAGRRLDEYLNGQSPSYTVELRYRCKDGSYKWLLSRGVVIQRKKDGSPLRFIGTHVDVSNRKQAEEDLRQAKDSFASSFNFSGTGKALIAPGGKWLEVNNVICDLIGFTQEELRELHYNDITFPDDIGNDSALIQQLISKEIPSYSIEKRYVAKDRGVIATLLTVSLVWKDETTPKYFVCDIVDITRKNQVERDLKRKNYELESTSNDLLDKMNQLEELNNIIAHNLRGPTGSIELLSADDSIFDRDEAIQMIHGASLSLLDTLNTMVEVTRIRSNKKIELDDCNLYRLVDDLKRQLQGMIYQHSVKLELNFEIEKIFYPKLYLESILYNLVSNAIKYRRNDIVTTIELSAKKVDGRVRLTVKDNGLGIDLAKYGHKLFKLNQTFHHGYDSKGVGLFMTKTQIESLGGSIEARSEPNQGCEFVIVL